MDIADFIEIIPKVYYFTSTNDPISDTLDFKFINIDNEFVYERFFADFGPLNLGQIYRYCVKIKNEVDRVPYTHVKICHYTLNNPHSILNSLLLVMSYEVLMLRKSLNSIFSKYLERYPNLPGFRDASFSHCQFSLLIYDVVKGLFKSLSTGLFDFNKFNVNDYEKYDEVKDGDMNWIVPGKLLAFSGPTDAVRHLANGIQLWTTSKYAQEFTQLGVSNVVRLNEKLYDPSPFLNAGIRFHDLFFPDGSCPPDRILKEFLSIVNSSSGSVAVHCKAGLGRTGSLIGCYLIQHYGFTAHEAIGWMRLCRPGSVLGAQQSWLLSMQEILRKTVLIPPLNLKRTSLNMNNSKQNKPVILSSKLDNRNSSNNRTTLMNINNTTNIKFSNNTRDSNNKDKHNNNNRFSDRYPNISRDSQNNMNSTSINSATSNKTLIVRNPDISKSISVMEIQNPKKIIPNQNQKMPPITQDLSKSRSKSYKSHSSVNQPTSNPSNNLQPIMVTQIK